MKNYSFGKENKLKSKKEISRLFKSGKFLFSDNLKLKWDSESSVKSNYLKLAVSVPKKKIKKAYQRNLVKRRLREILRLNKSILEKVQSENISVNIFIIYDTSIILSYKELEPEIINLFQKISCEINNKV